jgi:hypothetical protein
MQYGQKQQWRLLERWYLDSNPHKVFPAFLRIHGFPNNQFEQNGLYYLQICRKFWFASRTNDPLIWVRRRIIEDEVLDDSYGEPTTIFTHESDPTYKQIKYREAIRKVNEHHESMLAFASLITVSSLFLLSLAFILQ